MLLTEKHIIDKQHELYAEIDKLCFLSKNLFNVANYYTRQAFIATSRLKEDGKMEYAMWINYYEMERMLKKMKHPDYIALPRKVSQQILMQLHEDWKSFFNAIKDWKINPSKYSGKPNLPHYKKVSGGTSKARAGLSYTIQTLSKKVWKKEGLIGLSGTAIKILSQNGTLQNIKEVRLTCMSSQYKVEVVYEKEFEKKNVNKKRIAGGDVGVNNLIAITSNTKMQPFLINGRPLKSMNQYYNKKRAELMSQLMKHDDKRRWSKKLSKLTNKRNNKIDDYLHNSSTYIINRLVENNIGTFIIGKNPEWKQEINIGSTNNQNFLHIPHARFIEMLQYKGVIAGIEVIVQEESYTSKCSFLDKEEVCKHETYAGKRIKRGLFRSKDGTKINADCNGSGNIIIKAIPDAFADGIEGVVVRPVKVVPVHFHRRKICEVKKQAA